MIRLGITVCIASATVASSSQCIAMGASMIDTDMSGDLVAKAWAASSDDCCPLCQEHGDCEGFAFFNDTCYLKANFSGTYHKAGVVSRYIATAPNDGGCSGYDSLQQDRDLAGTLLEHWFAANDNMCCVACTKKAECQGFSFAGSRCYLKGNLLGTYDHTGVITRVKKGVLPEPSSCPEYEAEAVNSDMTGDLISQQWAATSDSCCSLCKDVQECEGFSFSKDTCYLKKNFAGIYYHLGSVTRITVTSSKLNAFQPVLQDMDLAGDLLEDWYSPTSEYCGAVCARKFDCQGFVFVDNRCYLKGQIQGVYENAGRLTRVKFGVSPTSRPPSPTSLLTQCPNFLSELPDTDMSGDLIAQSWAATSDGCCASCQEQGECEGFAYFDNICYLKSNFSGIYYHLGAVARVKTLTARSDVFEPSLSDSDVTGELLEEWFSPAPEVCMASCARKPECEGFTFFDSKCYLKIGVQGVYHNPGRIARVKRSLAGNRRLSALLV